MIPGHFAFKGLQGGIGYHCHSAPRRPEAHQHTALPWRSVFGYCLAADQLLQGQGLGAAPPRPSRLSGRPAETGGQLVFQEGKKIEGEDYIIAVYGDPEKNTVSFAAYELETNATYTLPYTYTELDELFKYNR